jgi:hypothetical protein
LSRDKRERESDAAPTKYKRMIDADKPVKRVGHESVHAIAWRAGGLQEA